APQAVTPPLEGVLFDLYGTLLAIGRRSIHREVPRVLGAPREAWAEVVRNVLLVRPFPDADAFVHAVGEALGRPCADDAAARCAEAVAREVGSVTRIPGVLPLLQFLRRRGLKTGVVSNLVSPHVAPLETLGLAGLFDAHAFSCDEGIAKPEPEIYRRASERLGILPERLLFVGDSARNDVEAPAALGMRTAGVGVPGRDATLAAAWELGLLDLSREPFAPLLSTGSVLEIEGERLTARSLAPVPDDELGRYNLVYEVVAARDDGIPQRLYVKRALLPEAVHVEVFAYELQHACGLPACRAAVVPGAEPLLAVTEAPGKKFEGEPTREQAFQLGMHCAFAYLFANADIRPRNAFWQDGADGRVTFVDLEHCLFNLAIDTEGLAEPCRPETFDAMAPAELAARVKKRVLSQRASSRARRSFYDLPPEHDVSRAYREGFLQFYALQRANADALLSRIAARLREDPPLVVGTHAYRRALASVDLEDIRARLMREPQEALDWTY
ncbi:MAG TPA: HAD-IA family hydrolase, partial [Thermoanaerobaculia bacterium]|nr:HAD-IA family hydrolase [Thermoanaerobaculia bacterium]